MNKRQAKKHLKKALKLAVVSFELGGWYLGRYRFKERGKR